MRYYHLVGWTFVGLTILMLGSTEHFGISSIDVCWVEEGDETINPWLWSMHHGPFLVIFVFSMVSLPFARFLVRREGKSDGEAALIIEKVIRHRLVHVLIYGIYYLIAGFFYGLLAVENNSSQNVDLRIFAVLMSGKGMVDAMVWLHKLHKQDQISETQGQIGKAIRKDIIVSTTAGIILSTKISSGMDFILDGDHQLNNVVNVTFDGKVENDQYQFKSDAILIFQMIRKLAGISETYLSSFQPEGRDSDPTERSSDGASGSFFYFTPDKKYVVKTTTFQEASILRRILPDYYKHLRENRDSLICRIYGLHSIRMYGVTMNFVVMENVTELPPWREPVRIFDLKGSFVNRSVPYPERALKPPTQKDNDLREFETDKKDGGRIYLPAPVRDRLLAQIEKDAAFFKRLNIMDYSLLLTITKTREGYPAAEIERVRRQQSDNEHLPIHRRFDRGMQASRDSPQKPAGASVDRAYHVGIIDILQEWNQEKIVERWFKIYCRFQKPEGVSAMPPDGYYERFCRFFREHISDTDARSSAATSAAAYDLESQSVSGEGAGVHD
eukprot:TRINITY_DN3776_c0_g1_i2.p1 TRINITY_DN3776_c0_g1~~TRINITY_DN3776_c0_g1_i2.p1  ORF type:complete len:556 (+),score=113.01 TRINITY_DN3776_c0_g1_i2:693-2360(+)